MGAVRAGVLGGTFDPPHLAHLAIGAAAKHALSLDRVIFVPAGDPWRKAGQQVTPAGGRVRMLRAALDPLPWAEVSTIEVDRAGPSYISETLPLLAHEAGAGTSWWFILGDDALVDMPHWHEPDRLFEVARLALVWRPPGEPAIPPEVTARFPRIEDVLDVVPMPPLAISATDIRRRIREGRSTEFLLPESVRAVVDELELYRG
jgi:nicotinate-nucleotide adenylyltransferase